MTEPKFGDRVYCLAKLRRVYDRDPASNAEWWDREAPHMKVWRNVDMGRARQGILIGYRTLRNVRVWGADSTARFEVLTSFRAALVVFGGNENPVYVPVDRMWLA
jgi:hypothetical protein